MLNFPGRAQPQVNLLHESLMTMFDKPMKYEYDQDQVYTSHFSFASSFLLILSYIKWN